MSTPIAKFIDQLYQWIEVLLWFRVAFVVLRLLGRVKAQLFSFLRNRSLCRLVPAYF